MKELKQQVIIEEHPDIEINYVTSFEKFEKFLKEN